MARRRWRGELDELRRDNRSAASELELRAVGVMVGALSESVPGDAAAYRRWLMNTGRQLIAAQPSMAGVFRLVNDLLWELHDITSVDVLRVRALEALDARYARSEERLAAVTREAQPLLAQYEQLMTYSRSATVLRALLDLGRRNRNLRVYCGEGRPNYEGQLLALDLGGAGVAVTLGIDMALFDWLPEVGALVVGADSVSHEGIVNKVGTRELMAAAAQREIPCIVLAATDKFLPNEYSVAQTLRGGDPDEVMGPAKNVAILNPYFGLTPLHMVSVLVTEQGPLPMHAVLEQLASLRIYPGLLGRRDE